jgi:hypothetical protein
LRQAALTAKLSEQHGDGLNTSFRRRVIEIQAEMLSRAMGHLADGSIEAVSTLRALLTANKEGIRLQAA